MKCKVTFTSSGSGSTNARLVLPAAFVEIMKITKDDRIVDVTYEDGKIIIQKSEK